MKNLWGKISSAGLNTKFGKALKKSTISKYSDPPKSKHMATILSSLQGNDEEMSPEEAMKNLSLRVSNSHWRTSFKALVISHSALVSSDGLFANRLLQTNPVISDFKSSKKGTAHFALLKSYNDYIRAYASMKAPEQSFLSCSDYDKENYLRGRDQAQLQIEISGILNLIGLLCDLPFFAALQSYSLNLTKFAASLIANDLVYLYKMLGLAAEKAQEVQDLVGINQRVGLFFDAMDEHGVQANRPQFIEGKKKIEVDLLDFEVQQKREPLQPINPQMQFPGYPMFSYGTMMNKPLDPKEELAKLPYCNNTNPFENIF